MEFSVNRRLLAALAAVSVAASSWWLLTKVEKGPPAVATAEQHFVDYYLKNFTLTAMDKDGLPGRKLVAESLKHFDDNDTAEIERPTMTVYRRDEAPWLVTADAGLLAISGEILDLRGAVRIARDAGPANSPLEINTRDVTVRLNDDYAETAAPVTIENQLGVTRAIGMTASLKEGRYELLQQVRGRYVPEHK